MDLSHLTSIDCDVHPGVPGTRALMPYLEDFWRDSVEDRDIHSLESISYPPNAPISARSDFRTPRPYPSPRAGVGKSIYPPSLRATAGRRWQPPSANCKLRSSIVGAQALRSATASVACNWC